jgi:hypothetical protein
VLWSHDSIPTHQETIAPPTTDTPRHRWWRYMVLYRHSPLFHGLIKEASVRRMEDTPCTRCELALAGLSC